MLKEYVYDIDLNGEETAARFLRLVGREKAVLEMGCSSGTQTRILKEQLGCRVTAVEINPEAARIAQRYAEKILVGNIEQIDFNRELAGQSFDVVTFADVLEHLYDPAGTLRQIKPFLKPDGCIVATVPNFTHAAIAFEMANGRFEYRKTGLLDDTHIRFFSRSGVFQTFERAGFHVVDLARSFVKAEETEFAIRIASEEDRGVLDYIRKHNPESETYHFIVKALPSEQGDVTQVSRQELLAVEDLARAKQAEVVRNEAMERALKAELKGITCSRGYRLMDRLRRLLS